MVRFSIDESLCVKCGLCVKDCPKRIIQLNEFPTINNEDDCARCQHCFAVCPKGAISILGVFSQEVRDLKGNLPSAAQLTTLMKGRRSVRSYLQQNLPKEVISELIETAWHAPTGTNSQQVLATVVDDIAILQKLRSEVYQILAEAVEKGTLPRNLEGNMLRKASQMWVENKTDLIFRNAPHFLVSSVPQGVPCPTVDVHVFMSYFELIAQAKGVGTLWNGTIKHCMDFFPEFRKRLGIPEDHNIGYTMSFGKPAVQYRRTVMRGPAHINVVGESA